MAAADPTITTTAVPGLGAGSSIRLVGIPSGVSPTRGGIKSAPCYHGHGRWLGHCDRYHVYWSTVFADAFVMSALLDPTRPDRSPLQTRAILSLSEHEILLA
jgi:hypothetical protein